MKAATLERHHFFPLAAGALRKYRNFSTAADLFRFSLQRANRTRTISPFRNDQAGKGSSPAKTGM
jgi:hypothetical protein